jgi:YVTN family beta-propeller protein
VCRVNTASGEITRTFTVGLNPQGLAITPNGKEVWVANARESGTGSVSIIDTVTQKVLPGPINIGGAPTTVICTPNGESVYVVDIAPE